jgi:polyphosphate kinase
MTYLIVKISSPEPMVDLNNMAQEKGPNAQLALQKISKYIKECLFGTHNVNGVTAEITTRNTDIAITTDGGASQQNVHPF